MVGHGRREGMLPVKPGDGRVLRSRWRLCRDGNRQQSSPVVASKLTPPEKIKVILIAVVVVDARHVNVRIASERIWHGFGRRVVTRGIRIGGSRQLRHISFGYGAFASRRNDV